MFVWDDEGVDIRSEVALHFEVSYTVARDGDEAKADVVCDEGDGDPSEVDFFGEIDDECGGDEV